MNLLDSNFNCNDNITYITKSLDISLTCSKSMLFKVNIGVQVPLEKGEFVNPFDRFINDDSRALAAIKRKGDHRYWDTPEFKALEAKVRHAHSELKEITNFYVLSKNWDDVIHKVNKIVTYPLFIRAINNKGFNVELAHDRTKIELMNITEIIVVDTQIPLKLYTINARNTKSHYKQVTAGVAAPNMEQAIQAFKDDERYKDMEILNVAHKGDLHIIANNPN